MNDIALPVYLLVKMLAYSGWCYLGLTWMRPERPGRAKWAFIFGLLRLVLGLAFGVGIFILSNIVFMAMHRLSSAQVLTYLLVYVPVRWFEWSILNVLMVPKHASARGLLVGVGATERLWRTGGIAIACLADIPMMYSIGGLPLGRFMC